MEPSVMYRSTAERVIGLLQAADPDVVVPACRPWSVQALAAHLVGLAVDVVAGDVDGYASAAWTDRQVEQRAGVAIADLVDEWIAVLPSFEAIAADLEGSDLPDLVETALGPLPKTAFAVAFTVDALQHELDLRVALEQPRPALAAEDGAVLKAMVSTVRGMFALADLPTVELHATDTDLRWSIGRGDPVATCHAPLLDLVRSLGGRRTIGQILALEWDGSINHDLAAALVAPFFSAPANPVESAT